MRGNSHDRARAVAGQDIVGDEHGDATAIHRVRGVHAQEHACFVFILLAFQIGLRDDGRAVLLYRLDRVAAPPVQRSMALSDSERSARRSGH